MPIGLLVAMLLLLPLTRAAAHEDSATARYLANEGVMIAHGDTRVVFDPLFNESFGEYRLVPEDMRLALMAGDPPWDGIDAVFISHYHDDHFAPADLVDYLRAQPSIRLFAPEQAVAALGAAVGDEPALLERVTAVGLEYGERPRRFELPGFTIEAIRIPHSGWPSRMHDVENIAWRITLDDGPTVLHLGDADTTDEHFARDARFWKQRKLHLALPPYWYFLSADGLAVLGKRLRPQHSVGIHVPVTVLEAPADRDEALRDADLFTQPGEIREIPHEHVAEAEVECGATTVALSGQTNGGVAIAGEAIQTVGCTAGAANLTGAASRRTAHAVRAAPAGCRSEGRGCALSRGKPDARAGR